MTEATPPIPEKIARYEIRREIGRGGMATVYLAHDPNFDRDVAIKALPHALLHDPTFRARFNREAHTIASLEHPAIVPVYDFGEDNGQPYLVMRYMKGGSLLSRIRSGPIPAAETAKILVRLSSALDAAHAKGIVHRDLKPGNILFDEYGEAYLSDFGIAQLSETTTALTGSLILGTPTYMSPEQIRGEKKLDGRSDIYALGVMVFEMITGEAPFQADSPMQMMMQHLSTPPPQISETDSRFPPGANAILERALAKEPDQRYSKAAEFGQAFLDISTGKHPISERIAAAAQTAGAQALPREAASRQGQKKAQPFYTEWMSGLKKNPRRWTPWITAIAVIAACLCLSVGGGGTILALTGWGNALLGIPAASAATATPTATASPTTTVTLTPTPTPTAEESTPTPSATQPKPGEPLLMTDGMGISSHPKVAIDSKGVVHVFWMDNTNEMRGKLYHRELPPNGTWTDPECVSCLVGEPKYVFDYQIASQRNGQVCVGFAWQPESTYVESVFCYRGSGPGESEEIPMQAKETAARMDTEPSGNLVFAFLADNSIRIEDQTVTDGSLDMLEPVFGIDSKGGYHLAWIRNSQTPVLVYRYSADQGASWSAPKELAVEGIDEHTSLILFDGPNGEMHLLIDEVLTYYTMRWEGNWSKALALSEDLISFGFTFLAESGGQVSLLSLGYESLKEGIWIFRGEETSGGWSQPILLSKVQVMTGLGISAARGADNSLHVVYAQSEEISLYGDVKYLKTTLPW
jgi:hypothetical protein